ncbi:hypothetical protein BH18THE2_BH18THE2_05330 [soil metagenome]
MWSSRKYSVKRHILTIHGGFSVMVSFIEYIVGRQTGIYRPPFPAAQTGHRDVQSREMKKTAGSETFQEEYCKEMAREAARRDYRPRG